MAIFWEYITLFKLAGKQWWADKAPRLGAALAFYSILSIGPLVLITVAVAGMAFGEEAAKGHLLYQIEHLVGKRSAEAIQQVLANTNRPEANLLAALAGAATLLFSASGVFGELQDALNTIWKAPPPAEKKMLRFLRDRFLSVTMVLGIGFLLMVSLVVTALLSAFSDYLSERTVDFAPLLMLMDFSITFGGITLLFALIYKILPSVPVRWKDVWLGAIVSAGLFTAGKFVIGLYLGQSAVASTYGAAGSLGVLLIWIYYSAQILYFGAELAKARAMLNNR